MAKENIVEQIFSPIGQGIRGAARGLFPGAARAADIETRGQEAGIVRIQSLLQTETGRRFLMAAQTKMQIARADYYKKGGSTKSYTPLDKFDELSTLEKFKGNYIFGKDSKTGEPNYIMSEEDKAAYKAARDYVLGREISGVDSVGDKGRDFVGPPAPSAFVGPPAPLKHDRTEGSLPPKPNEGIFDRLNSYFQAPTETVPEANIPKTFQQLGITSIDDQATLQEMQSAMPDRDMKAEYEGDPEYMQELIKLWRQGKLNKSNLHEAFTMIQQAARQSLGIA